MSASPDASGPGGTDPGRKPMGEFREIARDRLIESRLTPNAISMTGLVLNLAAAVLILEGLFVVGALAFIIGSIMDTLDGRYSRMSGKGTPFGAFLDSTLDRVADAALFGGMAVFFAWQAEDRLYLVISLVCLTMGSITSYARAKGEQLGYDAKTGLAERPDRLVGLLVPAFFGDLFDIPVLYEISLWLIAVLSTITVIQRILKVRGQALAKVDTESAPGAAQN
jgi:CDP-diacylglycerol--glycerol-3-phosphate 3-phosphatidyltransferase